MPFTIGQRWAAFLVIICSLSAFANEITVFEVRKDFPMKNGQKIFRDYYINAGGEAGIKRGMIINVNRRRALYDAYQNRSLGNLLVPVGKLKVIHVQQGMAVARLFSSFSRANVPGLEFDFILVGDLVDMSSAYFEKKRSKKKVAVKKMSHRQVAMAQPIGNKEVAQPAAFKQPDLSVQAVH